MYFNEMLKGRRGQLSGPLRFDIAPGSCVKIQGAGRPSIRIETETDTAQIAVSFSGTTDKAYIRFDDNSNSNDAGFIMHETRNVTETDEGVLHLCPSDNNSVVDYVSIHGTNQADKIKLHTDGQISGVTTLTTSDNILINGDSKSLIVRNSAETDAGIKFQDSQATTTQNFELLYNCSSEDLRFKSDTNDNILYLEHDGNVGIGTNNPERNLEVVGTTHAKGSGGSAPFLITSTTNDAMFMRKDGNSEKHTFVDDGNDDGSSGGLGWRIYHGNGGFTHSDVYNFPVWARNFYVSKIVDFKQEEKKAHDKEVRKMKSKMPRVKK